MHTKTATRGGQCETGSAIRILIADDHPVVCFGLRGIIHTQQDMNVVAEAKNGREAVAAFREHKPDVTLMDLRMPEMSGLEAIREIRKEFKSSAFIVLTTYHGDEDIRRALEAGAQAYVLKGMSNNKLLEAIRAVHDGRRYLPRLVLEALTSQPPGAALSPREREILQLIVNGLNNQQIASALNISHGTVKWHVNMILSRLDVHDRTQAAMVAITRGLAERA
ncbi:MAG TPA: response regulator transcription factor [Bryobacteraceae bacterium]|nr:response regulator transcription factor [Bryobacteraceae bacterium]